MKRRSHIKLKQETPVRTYAASLTKTPERFIVYVHVNLLHAYGEDVHRQDIVVEGQHEQRPTVSGPSRVPLPWLPQDKTV